MNKTEVKECWPIITFLLKQMFNYTFINVQLGNLICKAGLKFPFITSASCGPIKSVIVSNVTPVYTLVKYINIALLLTRLPEKLV